MSNTTITAAIEAARIQAKALAKITGRSEGSALEMLIGKGLSALDKTTLDKLNAELKA